MKKKINSMKMIRISWLTLFALLVLFWLTSIVFSVFGAYFPVVAEPIEEFFTFLGDSSLLEVSRKYLIYSSVVLVFILLYKDLKNKFLNN